MATLLVVDDDAHFRRLVSVTLSAKGHQVLEAARCSEGNKLLRGAQPELIILDGLLPDGDGAAWIKQHRAGGLRVPVLFVSAFRKSAKDQQALVTEWGVEATLAKPVSPPDLLAKVERMLQRSPGEAGEPAALSDDEQRALAEMSRQYAHDLPGLVQGLQEAVRQLEARPREGTLQGVARRRAHQIAGSAGSFGFADIGDACARIEQAIINLQQGGDLEPVQKALQRLVLADFPDLA